MKVHERISRRIARWMLLPVLGWPALPVFADDAHGTADRPLFVMDEDVWATFYDVPSRRFRRIRDAFIRRDFEQAAHDLQVSVGFLTIEAERAVAELRAPLEETIGRLGSIRERLHDPGVGAQDLDAAFARTHWLLAQHYLVLTMQSRDRSSHRIAGHYLWGSAHHLERAVLWSDARISNSVLKALTSTRDMATQLQAGKRPQRVYRDKPVARMAQALIEVGEHLDRRVWVSDRLP